LKIANLLLIINPFVEIRDAVELLVGMVAIAYGLPYKHEDHTTAIILIDAQLKNMNSKAIFAKEQDQLEMIRILLVWKPEEERLWTLKYRSTISGEYSNSMKSHQRMTDRCKRHGTGSQDELREPGSSRARPRRA
jgi:hypothetical protein